MHLQSVHNGVKHFSCSLLSLIIFFFCYFQVAYAWAGSCVTTDCHSGFLATAGLHAPVEAQECSACHLEQNTEHPSGSGPDFSLSADGAALCYQCHSEEMFKHAFEHGPVAFGACTYCHAPHRSVQKPLLRKSSQELCLDCHADFVEGMEKAPVVHSAIEEQKCIACHRPHGSNQRRLLDKEMLELCFDCHQQVGAAYRRSPVKHGLQEGSCGNCHLIHFSDHADLLRKDEMELCLDCHGIDDFSRSNAPRNIRKDLRKKEYLHGPIQKRQCSPCHAPHGAPYGQLMRGPYPSSFYAPYEAGIYDFCFGCHQRGMLASRDAMEETSFRNGRENLHYLHVARDLKGRACQSCHASHASNGPKLIDQGGVPFGDWKIPIRFETTENGGTCMPGCHRQMAYDREQPVDNQSQPLFD